MKGLTLLRNQYRHKCMFTSFATFKTFAVSRLSFMGPSQNLFSSFQINRNRKFLLRISYHISFTRNLNLLYEVRH